MSLLPDDWAATLPPKDDVAKVAKGVGTEIVGTMTNSLVVVAGFAWVQALQSLFDPKRGIFKHAAKWGPWVVAIVVTLLAASATQLVERYFGIKKKS